MRVHLFTGPRARGDSRITLLRVVRPTWKFSLSLHPYWWRWERGLGRLRMTLCGLNLHVLRAYGGRFY